MSDREGKKLYQFIVDHLGNPELHADKVDWQSSDERIFRITNMAALAEAWGCFKGNPTYSVPSLRMAIVFVFLHFGCNVLLKLSDGVYQFGRGI